MKQVAHRTLVHGIPQKTEIFIVTVVRHSNPKSLNLYFNFFFSLAVAILRVEPTLGGCGSIKAVSVWGEFRHVF
jgi:hypothetical protein